MRRYTKLLTAASVLVAMTAPAGAVSLNVDSAPNVYGSPNWAPWWAQAKTDVVAGTFTDMRSATNPQYTRHMDPYDEIVYSTMDLGKRLHWIYWLPGETTAGLAGNFEVKWVIDWAGNDWTQTGAGWALDGPEVGWSQPSSWENYDDGQGTTGVIGSLGFAWWSTDNDAPPFDTGGSAYDEVDQADIDALRQMVFKYQSYATGMVRYRSDDQSPWEYTEIRVDIIPEPLTVLGVGLAAAGLGGYIRRRRLA